MASFSNAYPIMSWWFVVQLLGQDCLWSDNCTAAVEVRSGAVRLKAQLMLERGSWPPPVN